jgi:uncharacterized membrane protein YphA (DoxX/SURF4 family)
MEITGGLLLVIPLATKVGVVLLVTCMAGAIVCHVFVLGDPLSSIINVGLIAAILAAGRKVQTEKENFTKLELR